MSIRSTIIAFVIAVLGIVAAWQTADVGTDRGTAPSRRLLLPEAMFPEAEIERIELNRADEAPLAYERNGSGWRQVEPFAHPVDQYSIQQLISQARRLEVSEQIDPDPETLAGLTLDPPRATVTYSWNGDSLTIALGRLGLAGQAYVRMPDGSANAPVYVVGQQLHDRALDWDPKEWRQRRLFQDVGVDSDSIVATLGDSMRIALERDQRTWLMTEPFRSRLDDAARDQLMQAVGNATSTGFIVDQPDDLSQFGLAPPQATLEITTTRREMVDGSVRERPDTQRLLVGIRIGTSNDRFGMIEGRPTIVRIPEAALARLFPAPESLAARDASGANPADVRRIVVRTGTHEFTLERDLEQWIAPDHNGALVPTGAVNELLDQMTELKATEIAYGSFPVEQQVGTVTLYGFDLRPIDTIRVARKASEDDASAGRWIFEIGDGVLKYHPSSLQPLLRPGDFDLPG